MDDAGGKIPYLKGFSGLLWPVVDATLADSLSAKLKS